MRELELTSDAVSILCKEITALRSDLNRFRSEVSTNKTKSLFNEFRNQCAATVISESVDNAFDLIGSEGKDCPMWTQCKPTFINFFDELIGYAKNGQLSENNIAIMRSQFDKIKKQAAEFDQCSKCFRYVEAYFDRQVEILQKMGIYQNESSRGLQIQDLREDQVSSLIGESLSSAVRVQILKALYDEGKSFTELSKITKLRGGNLLFHLEKLLDKGLIRQREERGEYQISLQGYHILNSMLELMKTLSINDNEPKLCGISQPD
ncbi:winged helix-turn-helix domain-containing protein [Methanohalophilus sp.]|uniref:winged helix-turn-helix domain-containing protein n=1 Tax=Methanohalophilus sp. TaxID=1966352 RepID=UPI00263A1C35|nr:winged helix-turn-helix domain-containing protein [Methanohalophilus sp.]MDK2892768.1 hypothetical protein [Methanohalophilus sp.]